MTQGARGEGYIDEENQQYPVLFTNRALAEAERALDQTILELMQNATRLGINAMATLLKIGLEEARKERRDNHAAYTVPDAIRIMDEFGYGRVTTVVAGAMAAVVTYSKEGSESPPG